MRPMNPSAPEWLEFPSRGPRLSRRPLLVPVLLLFVLVACGGEASPDEDDLTVEGVIVDVQGSITKVDTFDMALPNGDRLTIVPPGGILERSGFSPAHLREHMALVEPIAVSYREEDGHNVLTAVGDAGE